MKSHGLYFRKSLWTVVLLAASASSCGKAIINRGASAAFSQETVNSGTGTGGSGGSSGSGGASSSGNPGGGGGENLITCYKDEYHEPAAPGQSSSSCGKVDMLFVVSTAASFDAYRAEVATAVEALVETLPSCVDYRFAVMLAHSEDQWSGTLYPGCEGPLVLRSDQLTPTQIGSYLANRIEVNPGESASDGGEAFTISVQKSLQQPNSGWIQDQGFYRADAALNVITMTARNDICWIPRDYPGGAKPTSDPFYATEQAERAAQCTGYSSVALTAALQQFKSGQPISGATFDFTPASTIPAGTSGVIGYTMDSFMSQIGGAMLPLDQPTTFATGLKPLEALPGPSIPLQNEFQLRTTFALLDPTTLSVSVDGNSAPYTLNDSSMELTLASSFTGLKPESVVDIDYCTIPVAQATP